MIYSVERTWLLQRTYMLEDYDRVIEAHLFQIYKTFIVQYLQKYQ
jgi:hypothetical protein